MNAVIANPLQPALDALERFFPKVAPLPVEDRRGMAEADKAADEREAARADFTAKRVPSLVRQFREDDSHVDEAFAYATEGKRISVGMRLAYRNEDDAELGRLIRARMAVYLHDQAIDAATDESFAMVPEVES
jgi:hypothetical protein